MWQKFKKFAFKGNIIDMAVGVIIGGAFGKIVTSLVNDIIMPAVSLITGGVSFTELFILLNVPEGVDTSTLTTIALAKEAGCSTLNYGNFIQTFVDFFIIALSMFFFVTLIAKANELAHKKEKEEAEAAAAEAARIEAEKKANEPKVPTSEELLTEIRDLLKNK